MVNAQNDAWVTDSYAPTPEFAAIVDVVSYSSHTRDDLSYRDKISHLSKEYKKNS